TLQELLDTLEAGPSIAQYGKGISTALQGSSNLVGIRVVRGVAEVGLDTAYYQLSEPQAVLELGQIVYTASDLPSVKSVLFYTNGTPVDVEAAGGNTVSGPVTSADYCHESFVGCPHSVA
ncbi:MAG TPA: GerMN domain-containing protein, partial [Acidimicrobiales bacterium]|nr:GerMN domain-containing protein [Acidimicrobiales bacterium]